MRYFLKKDLPGIKAGTEMSKSEGAHTELKPKHDESIWVTELKKKGVIIPNSELSDWIEERDAKWKPEMDEMYFFPTLEEKECKFDRCIWIGSRWDFARLAHNIVCPTSELAIELADRMIETAKKFWEEKK